MSLEGLATAVDIIGSEEKWADRSARGTRSTQTPPSHLHTTVNEYEVARLHTDHKMWTEGSKDKTEKKQAENLHQLVVLERDRRLTPVEK